MKDRVATLEVTYVQHDESPSPVVGFLYRNDDDDDNLVITEGRNFIRFGNLKKIIEEEQKRSFGDEVVVEFRIVAEKDEA